MLSTRTKAKAGTKAARGIVESPLLRTAAREAVPPLARAGVKAGKGRMSRKTRRQLEHLGESARTAASVASTYAPQVAQAAQEFGLAQPPRKKRTAPRVLAGVLIGAAGTYLLDPRNGRLRRALFSQAPVAQGTPAA